MQRKNHTAIIGLSLAAVLLIGIAAVSAVFIKRKSHIPPTEETVSVFEEETTEEKIEEDTTETETEEPTTKQITTFPQTTTRYYTSTTHRTYTQTTAVSTTKATPITTKVPVTTNVPTTTKAPITTKVPITKTTTTTAPAKPTSKVILKTDAKGQKIIGYFSPANSIDAILDDISNIDLYFDTDFKNKKYTIKKITEEDFPCSKYEYYDGGKLVYVDYSDYGRDYFEYHAKTKSGKAAVVGYLNQQGQRYSVSITTLTYTVTYSFVDKSAPLGAQNICIEVCKRNANDIDEFITYFIENKTATIGFAQYYSSDVYKYYVSLIENGKASSSENVLFGKCTNEISKGVIDDIKNEELMLSCQTVVGTHNLSFKKSGDSKKWYMTMTLYLPFWSKEAALSYAEKHSLPKETVSQSFVLDDTMWIVSIDDVTLPIAQNAKLLSRSFKEFATMKINEYTFTNIEINDNYEITTLTENNSLLYLPYN